MQDISSVSQILATPQKIVITTHQNPDADALGSSLALFMYLKKLGHAVTVISATPYPTNLAWMANSEHILIYEHDPLNVKKVVSDSTMLWCLDFNIISRTKTFSEVLKNYSSTKVLIDHHMFPDEAYFDYGISTTSKSSTCEMVYDFITKDHTDLLDMSIGDCLYAGAMTDTGSFRFSSTTASTHKMIAHLLEIGVIPNLVHEAIFDTHPEKRLRLLGHILSNRMELIQPQQVGLIALTEEDAKQFEIGQGDTEGMVNYPLGIQGIVMSAFMTPKDGEVRISFRSKGQVDVNAFSRAYFEGGGHFNAAGGKSNLTVAATVEKFKQAIQEFLKK
jgi:bifunctional oligoribonuclease and PAP phosphatase NrnA